uniref:Integrase catalytic domain-containing protein n=1 Tax=Moniliophthora roreri TaxID=221103 RepID=A0A0W0GCT7_MONRR
MKMVQLDALSQQPDLIDEEEDDNGEMIMLPDKLFINIINTKLRDELEKAMSKDDFHQMTLESLIEKGMTPIKSSLQDWRIESDLLFYKDQIYILNNENLRWKIVKAIHKALLHGHPGQWNMVNKVQKNYWWPGMTKFIKMFVDGCTACQQMNMNTHLTQVPLHPIGGHKDVLPFQIITMDFITDLPAVDDCDSILVMVDHAATKGVIFILCNKKINAAGTVELLFKHIYKHFGLPDKIILDRDPRFATEVFREMGRILGINQMLSTTYHPKTDGKTERVNQEVEIYL